MTDGEMNFDEVLFKAFKITKDSKFYEYIYRCFMCALAKLCDSMLYFGRLKAFN